MSKSLLLCCALFTAACVSTDDPSPSSSTDDDTAEATQAVIRHPGEDWYYTCSNDLLVCRPGYGAVEWLPDVEACGSLWRIKCQYGAVNP